jgi:uncharacterized protein
MLSQSLFERSRPWSRKVHFISENDRHQLFVAEGSRLFQLDTETAADFEQIVRVRDLAALERKLSELEHGGETYVDDLPPQGMRVRALSLAVAQSCNLG